MKKSWQFSQMRFPCVYYLSMVLLWGVVGCAAQADLSSKHSEVEYGWGVTGLIGKELPVANTSVHGLVSYHRYAFTGGHDNLVQVGFQGRKAVGENHRVWLGGELTYLFDKSIYDQAEFDDPSANGYSFGALAGHKLPIPALDASVFTGVSFIHFGEFKSDDLVIDPSGNSVQLKLGVEVNLPFY